MTPARKRAVELLHALAADLEPGGGGFAVEVRHPFYTLRLTAEPATAAVGQGDTAHAARRECREAILAVMLELGKPMLAKEIAAALRLRRTPFGTSTVAKTLADLTRGKVLVNLRGGRGYALAPEYRQPSLF
jgi:hypothetical protein